MARVEYVTVSMNISYSRNGTWVKPGASVNVKVLDGDNLHDVFKRAFEVAEEEVGKQIDRLDGNEDALSDVMSDNPEVQAPPQETAS